MSDALCLLFEATGDERNAIQMRARMKQYAKSGGAVEDILRQLGLSKEASGSAAR